MFVHKIQIQLYHTDAAGILFYSRLFDLAFEAFNAFLQSLNISVAWIIRESDFLMPYVHAEADYLIPLKVGDEVVFHLKIERIGNSSFVVHYAVHLGDQTAATIKTVHVTIDKLGKHKIDLPEKLRQALESYFYLSES